MPFKSAKQARFFYAKVKNDPKFSKYKKQENKISNWNNLLEVANKKVRPHFKTKDPQVVLGVRG